jgi:hypothetical protein
MMAPNKQQACQGERHDARFALRFCGCVAVIRHEAIDG